MKKSLSFLLISTLLFCSLSVTTSANITIYGPNGAQTFEEKHGEYKGFVYSYYDFDNTVSITNYKGKKTEVTVPKKIKGKKVANITGYGKIKKLHVPNGIRVSYISTAKNLKKITVNKTNKLYTVKNNLLLNNDKTILYGCLSRNKNPKIPATVKTIEVNAFSRCKSLKTISIPDSVTVILPSAFSDCKNLKRVKLSKNLKSIHDIFDGCKSLKKLKIPKSVESISASAMFGCDSLEKVYIYNKDCKIFYDKDFIVPIPKHTTIYGYKGSRAQKYAKRNGNKFVILK